MFGFWEKIKRGVFRDSKRFRFGVLMNDLSLSIYLEFFSMVVMVNIIKMD